MEEIDLIPDLKGIGEMTVGKDRQMQNEVGEALGTDRHAL